MEFIKILCRELQKGHGGPRWKLEAERACFCSSGDFKTYDNLWEVKNREIPIK
jgi:hypothetical protein